MLNKFAKKIYRKLNKNYFISIEGSFQFDSVEISAPQQANDLIRDIVLKNTPSMISRFGKVELNCVNAYLEKCNFSQLKGISFLKYYLQNNSRAYSEICKYEISNNAGVFPDDHNALDRFSEIYLDCIRSIDVLGVWKFIRKENEIIKKYCPNAKLVDPAGLEPYYHQNPWSSSLKGKKILVVSPFAQSIYKNYQLNQSKIFENKNTLPEFTLKTLKAVQSIAGNSTGFKSWFEAIDYMKNEISKIDFDVAILGCGAYGLPLASYIKDMGKIAIHLGGATQILFGIKGKRWDDNPAISKFYNQYWVRPDASEIPSSADKVENGCYW